MRCASVGSGSKGNALLVEYLGTTVLIDCGFPFSQLEQGFERLAVSIDSVDAVFITHEHGDHIRGLKTFAKRTAAEIYMSYGTADASNNLSLPRLNFIIDSRDVHVGSLSIRPVTVPHDSREPYQFVVRHRSNPDVELCEEGGVKSRIEEPRCLGVLTDLGSIPPHVSTEYASCDALVIEANHDENMLREGAYPYALKRRVGGNWGHLSNRQTADFLSGIDQRKLQWMVVAHISEQNNCTDTLDRLLREQITDGNKIHYACQQLGFEWLEVQ